MPDFVYQGYRNPFVGTLSALIQAPGEIEARRAQAVGAAQAAAAQQSGQAIGQAVQGAGQAIAAIPGNIQQARVAQDKATIRQAQIAQLKRQAADLDALDKAYSQPGGREAIINALPGHLRPTVQAQFDSSDKAHAEAANAQENADRLATDAFADTAAGVKAHGYDPSFMQGAISDLKKKYAQNPSRLQQLQQAESALRQNPTADTVKSIVDPLIQASPKRVELAQTAAKHAEDIRHNESMESIDKLKEGRQEAADAETRRHNTELEKISQATQTRESAAQAETARHNKAMEGLEQKKIEAANPFGSAAGAGGQQSGAQGPTGEDFLKTLRPDLQSQVKALAEGRQPFPTGMSYAKLQPLIALVTQYDPTFDAANYNARNKARTDLTNPSGAGGKIVNSLNTAVQHAGKLSDLIEALDNGDYQAANAVANWWNKQTGGTKVTNFNAVQPQLMKEIERLWRGAGGSQGDIDALKSSLGPNMGKQQQREALDQFVSLLEGKLQSTEQQRDNILGPVASKGVPIIFENNKKVLDTIKSRAAGAADNGVPVVGGTFQGKKILKVEKVK